MFSCLVSLDCIICLFKVFVHQVWGWSGGAKVQGKFQFRSVLLIQIIVGQGPIALAVGAGSGCLDIVSPVCYFSSFLGDGLI